MAGQPIGGGAVLIAVMNREDRRALFDTFDRYDFDAIYTAKDFAQAGAFLKQEARIDAILLEFAGEAVEAHALCEQVAQDKRLAKVLIVGLASDEDLRARYGWGRGPAQVKDWIRSPVLAEEALARVTRPLGLLPAPAAPGAKGGKSKEAPAPPDYKFAFDASQDELVLWDPATGLIVEVNPAVEQRSGVARAQATGLPFDAFELPRPAAERQAMRETLKRDGRAHYRCERQRADGSKFTCDAFVRLVRRGTAVLCLVAYREAPPEPVAAPAAAPAKPAPAPAAGAPAGAPPEVLRALQAIVGLRGPEAIAKGPQLLGELLRADDVYVLTQSHDPDVGVQLITHWSRLPKEPGAPEAPLDWSELLKRAEGNQPLVVARDAVRALGNDITMATLGYEAFVAVPLLDERNDRLGMLVVASQRPIETPALAEVTAVVAGRIGLEVELERAREQGRAKGLQDSLTSMPNRLLFNDRLETTIKEAHRTGEMFAVLFVDLDRFKTINDSLGHSVGDEVLVGVAKRLRAAVRGSDTVARYAGDEFTLILRHIVQREDVLRIAEKICRVLEAPLTLEDGRELHITASIGVSFYPDDAASAEKLLQHADVAMYSAKGMGRNTFQTYVAVPEESHQQRLALEAKLRLAEKNGELRVYYQPQVAAETEDIVGMEALIRWEHPELGMISPGFFIPLAEETGLIVPIGEWVMRQACLDAKRWQERFGLSLRISVNLSALQLRQPNLADVVRNVLTESALEPNQLELEVTESINVKSIPNLTETLQAIRDMGCSIAIDDFGTGQSSLDYIRRFPADRIKIDQVFVRNIGVDPDDEAIVRATINMAHQLNLTVIAEGVEYEEHLKFLQEHGCEELQGYLFCRPLPATSFENLLAEREKLMTGTG
jgi:diguanylate cyclase (GGDEF)-like protein/PAS domain S-box-containing protein